MWRFGHGMLPAATLVAIFMGTGFVGQAEAATFTVATTSDTANSCNPNVSGCSLREIINYENGLAVTPNPVDTIVVPSGSYSLSLGALPITQSLAIVGGGARTTSVDQFSSTADRVFDIQIPRSNVAPTVVISGLAIAFGTANANNGSFGGDIRNQGTLTLSEDAITNGTAQSGGGISNYGGVLTVTHSLVSANTASTGGADSGAIQNFGPNPVSGTAGRLTVDNSTIEGNTSNLGGGIFSWCGGSNGACSSSSATNTTQITNSTIAFNDGGARSTTGGGLLASAGTISVQSSIVALNTVTPAGGPATPSNCGAGSPGTISSLGHNLDSGTDCGFTAPGDLQRTNPQLRSTSPQDDGGNTNTLALHATSPALDAIPAGAPGCSGTDQRGIPRPQGTGCDIGAYELFQPVEGRQFSEVVGDAGGARGTPTIHWGDGTSSPGTVGASGQTTGTHTYAEEGTYTGTLNWLNSDGLPQSSSFDVKVTDAALAATATPVSATAGLAFSGPVAKLTDADPGATPSDYSATTAWGDGTSSPGTVSAGPGGQLVVSATHTYASAGSFPTSTAIFDAGGANATSSASATVAAPPAPSGAPTVVTGPPSVLSSTGAAFSGVVDPEGLVTVAHFEYGLDPQYFGGGPLIYDQSTPSAPVGSDFSAHPVTASVAGLVPHALYHVRLVASNSSGTVSGPDLTFLTAQDPAPPLPRIGQTANLEPVSGLVLIMAPPGKSPLAIGGGINGLVKGTGFIPLTEARQVPVGSQIDARAGTLRIALATGQRAHTERATLAGGLFSLAQTATGLQKGQATFSLLENAFPGAPSYTSCSAPLRSHSLLANAAAKKPLSSRVLQTLHASDNGGRFRTRGRYSAGTVRGTSWDTIDRCDGTLTIVHRGTVDVRDYKRRKTITVHAGHQYLAQALIARTRTGKK